MIKRRRVVSWLAIMALVVSLLPLSVGTAVAATGTTLVSGIPAPRYMAASGSDIYVTSAGTGGSEALPAEPGAPPPAPGSTPPSRGYSGAVYKVDSSGNKTLITDKLPSYVSAEGAVGPAGIVYAGGFIWVANGGVTIPNFTPLNYENSVVKIDPKTGAITQVANICAYEKANDPDKEGVDCDLYGMDLGADGMLYVADAAGNTLYKINPNTGDFSLVTVFSHVKVPAGTPPPAPGQPAPTDAQAVPTGVVAATDGSLYVGLLAGLNFGAGKVVKVSPGGQVSDVATGLNPVVGVEIGPDNLLYASEIATGFGQQGPAPGRVLRIMPNGSTQVVADNVAAPNGLIFGTSGSLYVATGTAFAPTGAIMRFEGVAVTAPTTQPPTTQPPTQLPPTGVNDSTGITFPTGYSVSGTLLNYWNTNGGLPVFGYPIDSERQQSGKVFQWFERNRLELHPENKAPYNVLLGRLGVEALQQQGVDWTTLPKVGSAPAGCQYFAATGHSLCGDFLSYWQSHGLTFAGSNGKSFAESLALFGYPISEPKMERNSSGDYVLIQWFERARFEFHPNNSIEYRVLLGRLGAEVKA